MEIIQKLDSREALPATKYRPPVHKALIKESQEPYNFECRNWS